MTGRGAGRPAKQYDASGTTVAISVPPQQHQLVGRLLARAVAEEPSHADRRAVEIAKDEGRQIGAL